MQKAKYAEAINTFQMLRSQFSFLSRWFVSPPQTRCVKISFHNDLRSFSAARAVIKSSWKPVSGRAPFSSPFFFVVNVVIDGEFGEWRPILKIQSNDIYIKSLIGRRMIDGMRETVKKTKIWRKKMVCCSIPSQSKRKITVAAAEAARVQTNGGEFLIPAETLS